MGYDGGVSLVDRDWQLVERMKADFWLQQKAALSAGEVLRLGDELRRYVQAVRPDWPDSAEREADLATHVRVSEALQHAADYEQSANRR